MITLLFPGSSAGFLAHLIKNPYTSRKKVAGIVLLFSADPTYIIVQSCYGSHCTENFMVNT